MTITSIDDYLASQRQNIMFTKFTQHAATADLVTALDIAGNPGPPASLDAGNATSGMVPQAGNQGFPAINAFAGGATGYVTRATFGNLNANGQRLGLFDCLFRAGAFTGVSGSVTLSAPPSYASRLPGTSYVDLQIYAESVTSTGMGSTTSITVHYLNEAGTAHTSTITPGAVGQGGMMRFPLVAGDKGVQGITGVDWSTNNGASPSFNVCVLRPLITAWINQTNFREVFDLLRTGMPQVYATSALFVGTFGSNANPECTFEIASL